MPCSVKEFDVQTNPVPSSSDAFIRTWKRQCTTADSRFAFLKKCGAVKLQMLFKLNLPGDLLSDILIVLNTVTASTAPEASQAEHLSQQHADSQLHIAETNGRKPQHGNSVAQLVFEILQSLTGEHGQLQTAASLLLCWADHARCARNSKICPDHEVPEPCCLRRSHSTISEATSGHQTKCPCSHFYC